MKNLLIKEFRLTGCKLTYIFIVFSIMTLFPGYPILMSAFFLTLGILYTFQFAREDNDTLYTALLPVPKSDVVQARYDFVIAIEMIGFVLSAIFTIIRMTLMVDAQVYVDNVMMSANLVYLAGCLIIMTLYNIIFVNQYFKTACYYGKPYILYTIAAFLVIGGFEALNGTKMLPVLHERGWGHMGLQIGALLLGALIYFAGTMWAIRSSKKKFDAIDL